MEELLFSVIIPIYNNRDYIECCVDSVVDLCSGVVDDYEIIIIDDGSTDGSAQLCDRLAKENPVCTVHHVENGGVSRARNIGIQNARGKYVCFLDADDLWDPKKANLRSIVEVIRKERCDVLFTGCHRGNDKGQIVREYRLQEKEYPGGIEALKGFRYDEKHVCSVWVKRSLLRRYQIAFSESLKYWEDKCFVHTCCWCAGKIVDIDAPLHVYRDNPMSAMNKKRPLAEDVGNMVRINRAVGSMCDLPKIRSIPGEDEKVRTFYQVLAVGNVMEIIVLYCRRSLNMRKLKEIIYGNGLDYAIENYPDMPVGEELKKQFGFYLRFPYVFALKHRVPWLIKEYLIPKKLKYLRKR